MSVVSTPLQGQAVDQSGRQSSAAPAPQTSEKQAFVEGWKPNREFTYGSNGNGKHGAGYLAGVDSWYTEVESPHCKGGKARIFLNASAWGDARAAHTFQGMLQCVQPVVFRFLEDLCRQNPVWRVCVTSLLRPANVPDVHSTGMAVDIGLVEFTDESYDFTFYRDPAEKGLEGQEPFGAEALREWMMGYQGVSQYISPWYIRGVWGEPKLLPGDTWSKNLLDSAIGMQHHHHLHLSFIN